MITLRPAQFSDHIAMAQLHINNWRDTYRGILSDHYLDHEVEQDRLNTWHERLQSPKVNQRITLAIENEKIVGFCCLYLDDDPAFGSLIDNLHVDFSLRKAGVGKMMVKDAVKKVIAEGEQKKMYLWVYEQNINARQAYERMNGVNCETVEKATFDNKVSRLCRIVWSNLDLVDKI
jgi:ribosomal protein S18 acetylase RimI-like enzyme